MMENAVYTKDVVVVMTKFVLTENDAKQSYNQLQKCRDSPTKNRPFYLKSLPLIHLRDMTVPPPSPPFKVVHLRFEHGLVLLTTLIRGRGGIAST